MDSDSTANNLLRRLLEKYLLRQGDNSWDNGKTKAVKQQQHDFLEWEYLYRLKDAELAAKLTLILYRLKKWDPTTTIETASMCLRKLQHQEQQQQQKQPP